MHVIPDWYPASGSKTFIEFIKKKHCLIVYFLHFCCLVKPTDRCFSLLTRKNRKTCIGKYGMAAFKTAAPWRDRLGH